MQGIGRHIWATGNAFVGEWDDDQSHGKGRYWWGTDPNVFTTGTWTVGIQDSWQNITWGDETYEGEIT